MSGDPVAGTPDAPPTEPRPSGGPVADWAHRQLYDRVIDALYALPDTFRTSLNIAGVRVPDLHTLNTALGASIERSVVENLNTLRRVWDPRDQYRLYGFVRQNQAFPDVLLQTAAPSADPAIIMGIELKDWFALAREGEPSFRYSANPNACAAADLLAVFPWVLDEVISGKPQLLKPFLAEARYAALHRNHYWNHMRGKTGEDARIVPAAHQQPYPRHADHFLDRPARDRCGNFGRLARGGVMVPFIAELNGVPLAGIPIGTWQRFFKITTEGRTAAAIRRQLTNIATAAGQAPRTNDQLERLIEAIADFAPGETPT